MRCMINHAHRVERIHSVRQTPKLRRSARREGDDILRCQQFSHNACGRGVFHWIRRVG